MESGTGHPPFVDAWLLGSKIGVAVSDSPYGGYKNIGFVYNKDGYTLDRSSWDAQTVSNTHIKRFNGKYYLYYCGSVDPGENARIKGTLSKRDRIQQNQLQNKKNMLPLNSANLKKILVVGENAVWTTANGGGSSEVQAKYEVVPLEGIRNWVGRQTEIVYQAGYSSRKGVSTITLYFPGSFGR